jgi:hypothetical protein
MEKDSRAISYDKSIVPSAARSEFNFAVRKKSRRYYRFDDDVVGHGKIESVTRRNFYRALSLRIE